MAATAMRLGKIIPTSLSRRSVPARRHVASTGNFNRAAHLVARADPQDKMPEAGLVQSYFTRDLIAEFVGCALFQVIGGAAPAHLAPAANGLGLTMLIYAVGNASGAHLNPAVTLMLWLRQQIDTVKALGYMLVQVAGCVAGALACTYLIPGVSAGMGLGAPGTFAPAEGLAASAVFGWECMLTFMLGTVVYGSVIAKPGFGVAAPIGIGLAVYCGALAAGGLTGCIMNPARALGPAIVFGLPMAQVGVYVAAEMAGGALAAVLSYMFYGSATADSAMAQAAVADAVQE